MPKPLRAIHPPEPFLMAGPMPTCELNDCIWRNGQQSRKLLCAHQPVMCRLGGNGEQTTAVIFQRINDHAVVDGQLWHLIRTTSRVGFRLDADTLCDVLDLGGKWHKVRLSQFCEMK